MTIPAFGLGTYRLTGQVVTDAVRNALELGYRAIDTAQIPSSTRREHLASNLRARDLVLSDEDMAHIATLDRGERLANPDNLAPAWDRP